MQIKVSVMADATRLIKEIQSSQMEAKGDHLPVDEESPLLVDDKKACKALAIAGQALRAYEVGKLITMGFKEA